MMKNTVFALLSFGLILSGCKKEEAEDKPAEPLRVEISGIHGNTEGVAELRVVMNEIVHGMGTEMEVIQERDQFFTSFRAGGFSFELPAKLESRVLYATIKEPYKTSAKKARVCEILRYAVCTEGERVGTIALQGVSVGGEVVAASYIYADRGVVISGTGEPTQLEPTVNKYDNLRLSKGWNVVYKTGTVCDQERGYYMWVYSNTPPDDLEWTIERTDS